MTFDEHVRAALDSLPPQLAQARSRTSRSLSKRRTRRNPISTASSTQPEYMPAKISIYRKPLEEDFPDPAELEEQIRITVLHELAHYFGFDEDRISELGYE